MFLLTQHLVGNQPPPKLVASHWPLQGRGGQRLGSHTLTSRGDARDRAGLDGTLNLDPSPTQGMLTKGRRSKRMQFIGNLRTAGHTF